MVKTDLSSYLSRKWNMIVHSLYWCFMASEMKHVHHNTLIKNTWLRILEGKIVFSLSVNMGCALCTSNNSLCLSLADSNFEAEFLQTHNAYRKQHGAPPFTINKNLCRSSQEWAEHLLSISTLMHSNGEYGENVYYAWSSVNKKLTG